VLTAQSTGTAVRRDGRDVGANKLPQTDELDTAFNDSKRSGVGAANV